MKNSFNSIAQNVSQSSEGAEPKRRARPPGCGVGAAESAPSAACTRGTLAELADHHRLLTVDPQGDHHRQAAQLGPPQEQIGGGQYGRQMQHVEGRVHGMAHPSVGPAGDQGVVGADIQRGGRVRPQNVVHPSEPGERERADGGPHPSEPRSDRDIGSSQPMGREQVDGQRAHLIADEHRQ